MTQRLDEIEQINAIGVVDETITDQDKVEQDRSNEDTDNGNKATDHGNKDTDHGNEDTGKDEEDTGDADVELEDGSTAKLSALKESYAAIAQERNTLMVERAQVEKYLRAVEALPPDLRSAIDAEQSERLTRESALMIAAIPEMATPKGRASVAEELYTIAGQYGYTPAQINEISDHKTIKMLLDFARISAKVAAAKSLKPVVVRDAKATTTAIKPVSDLVRLTAKARETHSHVDEMRAMAAL